MATCDPQTLANESACFVCLSELQLQQVQTELLCEILQAGGTGGQSCFLCGDTDPVDSPSCDCALYLKKVSPQDEPEMFYWEGSQWIKFISQ